MPMLVRGGRNALGLGALIAAVVLFGAVCSVDNSGLAGGSGGAGGKVTGGSGGSAGQTGGRGGGTAGNGSGGVLGSGGSIVVGTGGHGTGGVLGTGGVIATGGSFGTGGGVIATGGSVGTGGFATGGTIGTGGVAGGDGNGSGGLADTGGTGGPGGAPATGGMSGHGGGGGRPPSCTPFPSGTSLTLQGTLHCYWVHGSQIDWNSAETVCENEGGTLVTILSETENTTVVQLAAQANLFMGIGMSGQVFIGATDGRALDDRNGAGDYTWVTGEPWGYDDWHSGQPDGACTGCSGPGPNSGCACDHRGAITADGTWFDRTQTTTRPFVCEAIAR